MKLFKLSLLLICGTIVISCNNSLSQRNQELTAERDTLLAQVSLQDSQLSELQLSLKLLSSSMDSIAMQEGMLFLPDPENPNAKLTKAQIRGRLEAFQDLVARQYDRISELEDSLDMQNESLKNLYTIIQHYKAQIEQKDVEISKMKAELKSKSASISKLNTQINNLKSDITAKESNIDYLQQVSDQQKSIMTAQDEILNEGYYLVKSRKELTAMGIKTSNISQSNINLDKFTKIDIRYFNELNIKSSKVKILTQIPATSYELVINTDGTTTLKILSAADFWQFSNILIIQTR